MFEFLKKTFSSLLKKPEKKAETPGKKEIKSKKESKNAQKEVAVPMKFNAGTQGYEPDLEKLQEIKKKLESEKAKEVEEKVPEKAPEKREGFFSRLIGKLSSSKLTQEQFNELFEEFEITLAKNNVALAVIDKTRADLSKDLVEIEVRKGETGKVVLDSLKNSILSVLIEPPDLIKQIQKHLGVYTILFFGINGSGKTTSIAKLAHLLKKNNISCVMAAADTFRAASIEQLKKHGERIGVPVVAHDYGSDPSAVAFDAKKYAETNKIQVVLIDTAGRMYTKTNLLKEMEKIVRISKPDLKIFVGESITGNDATEQARTFNETAGIDGIILSKADVDEKAGTILSVSYITQKPIYFLGVGQDYDDLKPFTKADVLKNLGLE